MPKRYCVVPDFDLAMAPAAQVASSFVSDHALEQKGEPVPQLTITSSAGLTRSIDATSGETLMEAIRDSGFDDLRALCGGNCSCATCHVYIDGDFFGRLGSPSDIENGLLDGSGERRPTSRLSCQVVVGEYIDGLTATIAHAGDDG